VLILHEFEELEYKRCPADGVLDWNSHLRLFYARRKMAVLLAGLKREELR